jgi:hypothetical protein
MANTLTSLIPTIYEAIDVVSREMVGYTAAATRNMSAERAALNQSILVPLTPAGTAADNTAAVTPPNTGDNTIANVEMAISKSRHVPIRWNGEEVRGGVNAGWFATVLRQQFAQAMRTLVNEMEADGHAAAYKAASRAYGTAGTAPFGTAADLTDLSNTARVLDDNGAPAGDRRLVLGSAAVANLRGKQSILLKQNEAGTDRLLRTGMISTDPLMGFGLHYSGAVGVHTKGTGASYLANGAVSVGGTAITVDTGSGTILAGDIVTYAADSANKYVVGTALASTIFSVNAPGVLVAVPDNNAITVGNNYTPNVAFSQSALQFIARLPALPPGGDAATDVTTVVDPVSGMAFEVAEYKQFMQTSYHVRAAWGWKCVKPNHVAILIG